MQHISLSQSHYSSHTTTMAAQTINHDKMNALVEQRISIIRDRWLNDPTYPVTEKEHQIQGMRWSIQKELGVFLNPKLTSIYHRTSVDLFAMKWVWKNDSYTGNVGWKLLLRPENTRCCPTSSSESVV